MLELKNSFGSRKSARYLIFKVTEVSVNNEVVLDNFCLTRVYLANQFARTKVRIFYENTCVQILLRK